MIAKNQRILSFDGGGIRGIYQAHLLSSLKDLSLIEQVDLLAGTSTGAIIAAALAVGVPADKLVDIYKTLGSEIFGKRASFFRRHIGGHPSYSSELLRKHLEQQLPDVKFGECAKRVLIPAVSLNSWSPYIFDSENPQDGEIPLVDVLLATTAAPTYFRPHFIEKNSTTWVDGGLVCNNPSFEALYRIGQGAGADCIRVLSIGNGKHPATPLPTSFMKKKPLWWALDVTEICMTATSDDVHLRCEALLDRNRYIRVNTFLGKRVPLDDYVMALEVLPALAEREAALNRNQIANWLQDP